MVDKSLYPRPGVYIENVLSYPARVLMTGVPVFLGLVSATDFDACNNRLPDNRQFERFPFPKSPQLSIVRRKEAMRLPARHYSPAADPAISDRSSENHRLYLRAGTPMPASLPKPQADLSADLSADRSADRSSDEAEPPGAFAIEPKPQRFTVWPDFKDTYGDLERFGLLAYAVRGFFENEGDLCYVQVVCFEDALTAAQLHDALDTLTAYTEYDLVCVPDLVWLALQAPTKDRIDVALLQTVILEHCETTGDRMAILDTPQCAKPEAAAAHRRLLVGDNGAIYYPWLYVANGPAATAGHVPPCGHVAGIYNRCDRRTGVHKAPANELIHGAIDLERALNDEDQTLLNPLGVNCLRVFTRRGIRVWGARTLSNREAWRYVNVRRVFMTLGRWLEYNLQDVVFEPHTPRLWDRITRDLTAYLTDLARRGALLGGPGGATFYVKCDAETNPAEERETGRLVTEIGLTAAPPAEAIVIRIIHGPGGVRIEGPLPGIV
jgi:hypothetical protein